MTRPDAVLRVLLVAEVPATGPSRVLKYDESRCLGRDARRGLGAQPRLNNGPGRARARPAAAAWGAGAPASGRVGFGA